MLGFCEEPACCWLAEASGELDSVEGSVEFIDVSCCLVLGGSLLSTQASISSFTLSLIVEPSSAHRRLNFS